jgi:hypothetical protein
VLGTQTASILALNKTGRVRQVAPLPLEVQGEEVGYDLPGAVPAAAVAFPALGSEGVEPVVDRDLVAAANVPPGKHLDTTSHGIGIARVVEIAPGRQQDRAGFEVQLTEVVPLFLG